MSNEKDNNINNNDHISQSDSLVLLSNTISEGKYSYILKKSEKITSVLYKLTEPISDKDEIKWDIRELSSRVVADLALESISRSYNKVNVLYNTSGALAALISLCAVCQIAGYISEMNFRIIRSECEGLIKIILGQGSKDEDSISLESMLEVPEQNFLEESRNIKDTWESKVEDKHSNNNNNKRKEAAFLSSRQEMILRHLRKNGESAIKDITPNIPGCSEKTIQRELVRLVELGLLKRSGERRWSRYSVV